MTSVYAVVEGDGEQNFAQQVLAVHLGMREIFLQAARVGKPGHKGGNRWEVARKDIVNFLKMGKPERPVHVTSMFDYYGMRLDWPGRDRARSLALANRAAAVEQAIADDIGTAMGAGFDESRFIPYVQMHEFEALIFADPVKLCEEFPDRAEQVRELIDSVSGLDPEEINDRPTKAPSKRIIAYIPEYKKRRGSAAANVLTLSGSTRCEQSAPISRTGSDASKGSESLHEDFDHEETGIFL